jgi:hypothetical protein
LFSFICFFIYANQYQLTMKKTLSLVLTRFAFLLGVLFVFFFNLAFPFLDYIHRFIHPLLNQFIPWFGKACLGLKEPIETAPNGSGDTTYNYVLLLCVLLGSALGGIIWSALARKRKSHEQLLQWLIVLFRFYVGFILIRYGIAKLNDGQFPMPSAYRLTQTYGDSSPMGLAWTFLGYSAGYKWFMFCAEIMGFLLFFKRTATLGAFLGLMTALNIMAINYCFDVPVKMLSTALVLMCLAILSPNISNLFNLFFRGQTVQLKLLSLPEFSRKWFSVTIIVLKYLVIVIYAALPLSIALKTALFEEKQTSETKLYGVYEIESFTSLETPSTKYAYKWKLLTFGSNKNAVLTYDNKVNDWCKYQVDENKKKLNLKFRDDPITYKFNYQILDSNTVKLKGNLFDLTTEIILKRKQFELMQRKFHWISEEPYNR